MKVQIQTAYSRCHLVTCIGALAMAAASLSACAGPSLSPAAVEFAPESTERPSAAERGPEPLRFRPEIAASFSEIGLASWYGGRFVRRPTASGERFDTRGLTAAHRTLPMHTVVRVTNLDNGRMVLVRINDRGPYVGGRVIDLSRYAADKLDMKRHGVAPVRIEVFDMDQRENVADTDAFD
jgi:rare lipoprotein A